MAGEELVRQYESLMDRLPSEGLDAARARTLIARLINIVEGAREIIEKATCIAERSRDCRPQADKPCNTGCASIWVSPSTAWRYKRPFVLSFSDGGLRVGIRDATVTFYGDHVDVMLPAGSQYATITVSLANVDTIKREYETLIYTLKKIERPIRIARADLDKCSRDRQLAC